MREKCEDFSGSQPRVGSIHGRLSSFQCKGHASPTAREVEMAKVGFL